MITYYDIITNDIVVLILYNLYAKNHEIQIYKKLFLDIFLIL